MNKKIVWVVALAAMATLGVGSYFVARAASISPASSAKVVQVMGNYIEAPQPQSVEQQAPASDPNYGGTLYDQLNAPSLNISGASVLSGVTSVNNTFNINTLGTIVTTTAFGPGTGRTATTTLGCVSNPFAPATSTLVRTSIITTGNSTTSVAIVVATSTLNSIASTSTLNLTGNILAVNLAANTTSTLITSGVVDGKGGQTAVSRFTTSATVPVGPTEKVCVVAGEGDGGKTQGVTNSQSLFAETTKFEFKL